MIKRKFVENLQKSFSPKKFCEIEKHKKIMKMLDKCNRNEEKYSKKYLS